MEGLGTSKYLERTRDGQEDSSGFAGGCSR
jgi:hypothetical protein